MVRKEEYDALREACYEALAEQRKQLEARIHVLDKKYGEQRRENIELEEKYHSLWLEHQTLQSLNLTLAKQLDEIKKILK